MMGIHGVRYPECTKCEEKGIVGSNVLLGRRHIRPGNNVASLSSGENQDVCRKAAGVIGLTEKFLF